MIAGTIGTYRGRSALAIGGSHRLSNGSTVAKVGVTYNTTEHVAHAAVAGTSLSSEHEVKAALDGSGFEALNIERFVENDFFHWVHAEPYFSKLRPMFRAVARQVAEYDFTNVGGDSPGRQ